MNISTIILWSTPLDALFRRNGLDVIDVERIPTHGGSLRVTSRPRGGRARPSLCRLEVESGREESWGVSTLDAYAAFAGRVDGLIHRAPGHAPSAGSRDGHRIAAYGASAKGSTLLNYAGVGRETLDFVVDRNPVKQGRYTPGNHLPILPTQELVGQMPAYTLLLTWNFAEEILEQQDLYRLKGGRFSVPIPGVLIL